MTSAAVVFCCTIALALFQGFGAPAFVSAIAADAIDATMPFLGVLVVARFLVRRFPDRAQRVQRVHVAVQGLLASMAFGWWWVEPHAALTSWTSGSLTSMGWQALAGAAAGYLLALLAERARSPMVLREVGLGAGVVFLLGGGYLYRLHDDVEAGVRLSAAVSIAGGCLLAAVLAYFVLRRRERLATAIPALAPAVACLALAFAGTGGGPASAPDRDSVLLVVIDTLRADIADGGMHGEPPAMPELARIAATGTRFTQAVSPAPWTLPAVVSALSGWNPHRHRFGASASEWEVLRGDPKALYLPAALRDAGYLTAAYVNNPWLRPYFGFGEGFHTMRPYHGRAVDGVALALDWLGERAGTPSFTLLHLMDPHWPFDAPPGFGEESGSCAACGSLLYSVYSQVSEPDRADLKRAYTAEVRYTDAMFGRFHDALASSGALDRTWVIVTADHGEEFWEHGHFLHGHSLHDELLRVPLVVLPPRGREGVERGKRVDVQVRLEDVAATVLEIAGLDPALAPDGRSLVALAGGAADKSPRVSVAGYVKSATDLSWSVRRPPWKAISSAELYRNRLYRLDEDPGELRNLLFDPAISGARRADISALLFELVASGRAQGYPVTRSTTPGSGGKPDADTAGKLRSLGYAQ